MSLSKAPMHSPQQWAVQLFSAWGPDATLFVGGRIFDCKRSEDRQGEIFWCAVQEALLTIINRLCSDALDTDELGPSSQVH